MVHPVSMSAASSRSELPPRQRPAAPSQNSPSHSEREALAATAPEAATPADGTVSNAELAELGGQFAGLTRLLDDISALGESLPRTDIDAMRAPVFGVLRGVMDRIMTAPAATLADLGVKAQVVMWAKRDWWAGDAQLSWQDGAIRIFLEQTLAAAGLDAARPGAYRADGVRS